MKKNPAQHYIRLLPVVLLLSSCATQSPMLSLVEGKLRSCPKSPNCVSSESAAKLSVIAPVAYSGDAEKALEAMKETLLYMGAHIEREESHYLWATFRSTMLRYIDDVEVHLVPEDNVLHIRSGRRVDYANMGANRERVEHIRRHFNETGPGVTKE